MSLNIQTNYSVPQNNLAFKANEKEQSHIGARTNILTSGPLKTKGTSYKVSKILVKDLINQAKDFYKLTCLLTILKSKMFNYSKFGNILNGEDVVDILAFELPAERLANPLKGHDKIAQEILFDSVLDRLMSMSNWQCFKVLLKGLFKKNII